MIEMAKYNFPVYLINLEHVYERREKSIEQLDRLEINPIIVPAYNGHDKDFPFRNYKHLSRGKWWDKDIFKPGAFACYLSHAKCWEKIAMGSAPYGMILEDDMIINQEAFQKFNIENIPDSFDVLLINSSISKLLELTSDKKNIYTEIFVPFNEILLDLLIYNKFNDNLTPGGYAYIISKEGAVKLLEMMKKDKICMGVDYAIIFNSLSNNDIEKIKTLKEVPNYLQIYLNNLQKDASHSNKNRVELNSYIYTGLPPISYFHGESDIKHEVFIDFSVFNTNNNFLNKMNPIMKKLINKFKNKK